MNELLTLLGTAYSMTLNFINLEEGNVVYEVAIKDNINNLVASTRFHPLEAEMAEHDVLLHSVQSCIMTLQVSRFKMVKGDIKGE